MINYILNWLHIYCVSVLFGSFWIAIACLNYYQKCQNVTTVIYQKFLSEEIKWDFLRNNLDDNEPPLPYFTIILFMLTGSCVSFLGIHSILYEVMSGDSEYFLIDLFFAILAITTFLRAWMFGYKLTSLAN